MNIYSLHEVHDTTQTYARNLVVTDPSTCSQTRLFLRNIVLINHMNTWQLKRIIDIAHHAIHHLLVHRYFPDSKVHGANMGPTWGRQDPGGPHVGLMNFALWVTY